MMKIVRSFEPRFDFMKLLPVGGIVLDCGCGDFQSTNKLRSIRQDLNWHCLDINKIDDVPDGITFMTCNFESDKIPFPDAYFDGVYALHVVEHINNLTLYSKELSRVLKSGGHLFVEVPSVRSIYVPSSNFFDDITHKKPFTVQSLKYFIREYCGLRIVKVRTARNLVKICLTPFLLMYSIFEKNNYYMIGFGDLLGVRLYGIGKKQ